MRSTAPFQERWVHGLAIEPRPDLFQHEPGDRGEVQGLGLIKAKPPCVQQFFVPCLGFVMGEDRLGVGQEEAGVEAAGPIRRGDRSCDELELGEVGTLAIAKDETGLLPSLPHSRQGESPGRTADQAAAFEQRLGLLIELHGRL